MAFDLVFFFSLLPAAAVSFFFFFPLSFSSSKRLKRSAFTYLTFAFESLFRLRRGESGGEGESGECTRPPPLLLLTFQGTLRDTPQAILVAAERVAYLLLFSPVLERVAALEPPSLGVRRVRTV